MRPLKTKKVMAGESGMSLVEMMAALLVFALMTIGVVPLLASSLRGSELARTYTVGKNIAQESMESIRGLPYFIAYGTQSSKVDVLDLYFPCATSATCGPTGTSYVAGASDWRFETTCGAGSSNPACPKDIPSPYTVTFVARFVTPGDPDELDRETYAFSEPLTGYRWDLSPADVPASRMIELVVTTEWQTFGTTRSYSLDSLVTDRKVAEVRLRASGKVAYVLQVFTGFRHPTTGEESTLTALAGSSETQIETRLLSETDQSVESGTLRLVLDATETEPAEDLVTPPPAGASKFLHAPPDTALTSSTDAGPDTITHPHLADLAIASLGSSSTSNVSATTAGELPVGNGTSNLTSRFWVNNPQADIGATTLLHLDVGANRELIRAVSGLTTTTTGVTTSTTSGDRKVRTTASASMPDFRMFPVTFIPGEQTVRTLVQLKDFTATVDCNSTASASATAASNYDGDFSLWQESVQTEQGDDKTQGSFVTFDLGTATGRTALNSLGPTGTNPIVFEQPDIVNLSIGNALDVYLFATPGKNTLTHVHEGLITHEHPAFFTSWKALENVTAPAPSDGGRFTSALLADILQFNSTPLKPDLPTSAVNISVGNLSCEAVDKR